MKINEAYEVGKIKNTSEVSQLASIKLKDWSYKFYSKGSCFKFLINLKAHCM